MLPNYSNILVATDLSQNSVHAFKHAVMMARRNQAKIHLLHVVPEVDASMRAYISAMMVKGSLDKFEAQHEEEARQEIQKRLKKFAEDELADHPEDLQRIASIEVSHGHPVAKILQVADQNKIDVIVMGSHGKGAIEHAFLGSTTEKVLRKSKRPVFVIPLPD
ncbi:universal stress protein [Desulfuromonas versatilis]|uniref:Universal stress protein n=1 Tax=Desulfuromonas versatilis TaxID=2802975 RepID=A0ABN6DVQ4_9BACT|nr:universal stress protein [Desulfuromonas versatilis]BCR04120.1 universal stress protein [Desulfuromonas versatilis]